jgi:hypothetical protein
MQPNLATRLGQRRSIATALGLTLVLGFGLAPPAPPVAIVCPPATAPTPPSACPVPLIAALPDANAADLVGIYRSKSCTLTLDASGTYVSDCGGRHASRYTVSGDHVVLGTERLLIAAPGRLAAADGTLFSITEGTR